MARLGWGPSAQSVRRSHQVQSDGTQGDSQPDHGAGQPEDGLQGVGGGLGGGGLGHPQVRLGAEQPGVLGLLCRAGVHHRTAR